MFLIHDVNSLQLGDRRSGSVVHFADLDRCGREKHYWMGTPGYYVH